jgi:hypothetical protein
MTDRLMIAASWVIAIGLVVFVPMAAAALGCQCAWRRIRLAGSAPAACRPGGARPR